MLLQQVVVILSASSCGSSTLRVTLPCRVTCTFRPAGPVIGEGRGLLPLPLTTSTVLVFLLVVGVKERAGGAKVGPRVDADRLVRALVGEGHRFGGVGVSDAHCARGDAEVKEGAEEMI